jgi:hypothetical protein
MTSDDSMLSSFLVAMTKRVPRRVPDEPNTYERSAHDQACNNCFELKPAIEYHTQKRFRLGIAKRCKKCTLGSNYERTTQEVRCKQCEHTLAPTEFHHDRRQLNGIKSKCKKCQASLTPK